MVILIADDDSVSRTLLKVILEKINHVVVEVSNGQELVNRFMYSPNQYDLIITDFMMPIKDGLKAIKEIKSKNKIACIILSALDNKIEVYDENGEIINWDIADYYICKPIKIDEITKIVNMFNFAKCTMAR